MDVTTEKSRFLSPILMMGGRSDLVWSLDSKQINYIATKGMKPIREMDEVRTDIFQTEVESGQITQLTDLAGTLLLKPAWAPDRSAIIALSRADSNSSQFTANLMGPDGRNPKPFDNNLVIDTRNTNVNLVWVPTAITRGEK